jgi:hypothetical protein
MKRLLAAWGATLLLAGFGATGARSQTCFDFDTRVLCFDFVDFGDGLELTSSSGVLTGWWRNCGGYGRDCGPLTGFLVPGGHGNHGPGAWVVCDGSEVPCPEYIDWGFYIDLPLDGTMQAYVDDGYGWQLYSIAGYLVYPGPCPFAAEDSSGESGTMSGSVPESDR